VIDRSPMPRTKIYIQRSLRRIDKCATFWRDSDGVFFFLDQQPNRQNDRDARRTDQRLVLAMPEENGRFTSLFDRREAP